MSLLVASRLFFFRLLQRVRRYQMITNRRIQDRNESLFKTNMLCLIPDTKLKQIVTKSPERKEDESGSAIPKN